MWRSILISASCLAVTACVSGNSGPSPRLLEQAESATKLRSEIETLSTYAVAKYAGLTEDSDTAARNYSRLLRTVKDDPWLAEQAIFSVMRIGEVERAVKLAQSLPQATISQTEVPRLLLAVDAIKRNARDEALSYLTTPWTSDYHAMLARSLAAWSVLSDDPETAITLQQNAGGGEGLYGLMGQTLGAVMKANIGDKAGAQTDLAQLWDYNARLALGVEVEARMMAHAGDTELALQRLQTFRREVGRHPALIALKQEIESDNVAPLPTYSVAEGIALAFYLATAPQANQGYGDAPAVYFAMAVYLDPNLDSAKALWADTLDQADRRQDAIALLETIPSESVHHTSAQGQLAWALRREGRNQEALELARETLARTDNRNIRVQLADLLQSLDRDGEAEETFTQVIEADEALGEYDWRIYFARGSARERLGAWPPAEDDLRTAMNLNPNDPTIMNYLGYSWVDRGINLNEGLDLIEQALRLAPNNGAITDSLGWAHYKMGNYERAIFYLERATTLEPDASEILDHLGDAYWQVGRFKEAGFQWERALKYATDEAEKDLLRRKLDGGIALLQAATSGSSTTYP
ncbi:MAG: tetratricopeptide repeat protein [Hyphomonadaceae bacterium]|nr:tetratricopeptide repeat protein [Hyphomonadaceae bacterium]